MTGVSGFRRLLTATRTPAVGLVLQPMADGYGGRTARWPDLRAVATQAEALGFDALWLPDHLLYRSPFDDASQSPHGWWECWSLLAALAAATSRIALGTLVACANFRNPALIAKMADTIDEISGGRLILGLGAGYHDVEFEAFGFPADRLASRFAEALAIIVPLLRDGAVDVAGEFYAARDCELRPRASRSGGPPLLIAGLGPRLLELTARYADGWNVWAMGQRARLAPVLAQVDRACAGVGRDPATLARTAAVMVDLPGFSAAPIAPWIAHLRTASEPALTGSPEAMAAQLRGLAADGISQVQVWLQPNSPEGLEAFAPVLAVLDDG